MPPIPTFRGADTVRGERRQDEKEKENKMARDFNPARIPLQFHHEGPAIVPPTKVTEAEMNLSSRLGPEALKKKTREELKNWLNTRDWTSHTLEVESAISSPLQYSGYQWSSSLPEAPTLCYKCSKQLQETPFMRGSNNSGFCAPPPSPVPSSSLFDNERSQANVLPAAMAPEEGEELTKKEKKLINLQTQLKQALRAKQQSRLKITMLNRRIYNLTKNIYSEDVRKTEALNTASPSTPITSILSANETNSIRLAIPEEQVPLTRVPSTTAPKVNIKAPLEGIRRVKSEDPLPIERAANERWAGERGIRRMSSLRRVSSLLSVRKRSLQQKMGSLVRSAFGKNAAGDRSGVLVPIQ